MMCCEAIIKINVYFWRVFYRPFRNASENLVQFDLRFLPVWIFAFHVPLKWLKWLHILTVFDWFVWHNVKKNNKQLFSCTKVDSLGITAEENNFFFQLTIFNFLLNERSFVQHTQTNILIKVSGTLHYPLHTTIIHQTKQFLVICMQICNSLYIISKNC